MKQRCASDQRKVDHVSSVERAYGVVRSTFSEVIYRVIINSYLGWWEQVCSWRAMLLQRSPTRPHRARNERPGHCNVIWNYKHIYEIFYRTEIFSACVRHTLWDPTFVNKKTAYIFKKVYCRSVWKLTSGQTSRVQSKKCMKQTLFVICDWTYTVYSLVNLFNETGQPYEAVRFPYVNVLTADGNSNFSCELLSGEKQIKPGVMFESFPLIIVIFVSR